MPPRSKTPTVTLPQSIADEIRDAAARTHRSVSFIVARALAAGQGAPPVAPGPTIDGATSELELVSDEDNPPSAQQRAKKASPAEVAAAWTATRARFAAWIAREEEAQQAERADDLDAGLRDAADAATPPARLLALAGSEYVRVRALVAAHPATPPEALVRLREDKDRVVREALARRG